MRGVGHSMGPVLTYSHYHSGPAAGPAIPTSNSYSKKTQSNNAENKRPEEDRESGRKTSSTAKVPASPLPGLERKKTTPTPSTVSSAVPSSPSPSCLSSPGSLVQTHSLGCLRDLSSRTTFAYWVQSLCAKGKAQPFLPYPCLLLVGSGGKAGALILPAKHSGFL